MRAPTQRLIVRSEHIYNYYREHGSLKLYVDPLFNKGQAKIKSAIVAAIPSAMHEWSRIKPDVEVGDKVYFHYNALREESAIPDSDHLWFIEYQDVFCTVRNGNIIPIGSRVLVEALYDPNVTEVEIDGITVKATLTASGIVDQINVKHDLKKGKLAFIGEPLRGDKYLDVKSGDTIYFTKDADFRNTIEGKDYFIMYQDDIIAVNR